jgi:hypothetical protein
VDEASVRIALALVVEERDAALDGGPDFAEVSCGASPWRFSKSCERLRAIQPAHPPFGASHPLFENGAHRAGISKIQQGPDIPAHGETRTRTGDTTIFRRAVWAVLEGEIPGEQAVLARRVLDAELRNLRAFARGSGDGVHPSPLFVRAAAHNRSWC